MKCGADRYARDPSTEILCIAWCVDDGPVQLWLPGDDVPPEWFEAARNPLWTVHAFNDAFETLIEEFILGPKYGFPQIPLERHRCSAAAAAAMSLPHTLEDIALALDQIHLKDEAGSTVMQQTSEPRKPRKSEDKDRVYWYEDDERLARLYLYCIDDVESEREAEKLLSPYALSALEQELWLLDQHINRRGFHIDRPLVENAYKIELEAKARIDAELAKVTGGEIRSVNQKNFPDWFTAHGHKTQTVDKHWIAKLLARDDLDPLIRKVAELRQTGASTSKLRSLLAMVCDDDRIRGSLKFCGTGTRRWSGQIAQPQNMRRPRISQEQIDQAIGLIMTGDYDKVRAVFDDVLSVLADCTRSMINAGRSL